MLDRHSWATDSREDSRDSSAARSDQVQEGPDQQPTRHDAHMAVGNGEPRDGVSADGRPNWSTATARQPPTAARLGTGVAQASVAMQRRAEVAS